MGVQFEKWIESHVQKWVQQKVNTLKWEELEWFYFLFGVMDEDDLPLSWTLCFLVLVVVTRCWRRGPKAEWFKWIDHYFWTHSFPFRWCYNTPTLGWWWNTLPSLKLTWHLEICHPKRKLVFQPSIFRFYVSCREGNLSTGILGNSDITWRSSVKIRNCPSQWSQDILLRNYDDVEQIVSVCRILRGWMMCPYPNTQCMLYLPTFTVKIK